MTDVLAGQKIQSATWPATVESLDNTSNANLTNTTFATGTPVVDLTFVAPTTGRVLLTVTAGSRDNTGTDRVVCTFELYLGTSAGGTLVIGSSGSTLQYECTCAGQADAYQYVSRTTLVDSLTSGATYYVRHMNKTASGSGSADCTLRALTVRPTP